MKELKDYIGLSVFADQTQIIQSEYVAKDFCLWEHEGRYCLSDVESHYSYRVRYYVGDPVALQGHIVDVRCPGWVWKAFKNHKTVRVYDFEVRKDSNITYLVIRGKECEHSHQEWNIPFYTETEHEINGVQHTTVSEIRFKAFFAEGRFKVEGNDLKGTPAYVAPQKQDKFHLQDVAEWLNPRQKERFDSFFVNEEGIIVERWEKPRFYSHKIGLGVYSLDRTTDRVMKPVGCGTEVEIVDLNHDYCHSIIKVNGKEMTVCRESSYSGGGDGYSRLWQYR